MPPRCPTLVKFGGELLEEPRRLRRIAKILTEASRRVPIVVVHGGGREVDGEMARLGIPKQTVDGLRITDTDTLDVVLGVLAGRVNTRFVAAIGAAGGSAVGLTGVDGGLTQVRRVRRYRTTQGKSIDLGFVGVPTGHGSARVIEQLTRAGHIPVVASIGVDRTGRLYNVNADTLAGDLAPRIGARALIIAGTVGSAPLGEIAELAMREGPIEISRTDGVRSAGITGDIVSDDAQAVGILVQEQIDALQLPPRVSVTSGGVFADIAEGFRAVFISMAVGIVLVYLVMVVSLGSLRNPFVIVTTLPLALIGVFVALAITGRSLGLPAMMGALLLIGIVVTNAIVLIAFVEQQRAGGMAVYDALVSGARVRLRPILMTALTTSFALLPLAVATEGSGGIISAELATVVIGGLMSSTALTLIVLPIVYMLFNDNIPRLLGRLFHRRPPELEPVPAS